MRQVSHVMCHVRQALALQSAACSGGRGPTLGQEAKDEHNEQELQPGEEQEHAKALGTKLILEGLCHDEGYEHVNGGSHGSCSCSGLQRLHLCRSMVMAFSFQVE